MPDPWKNIAHLNRTQIKDLQSQKLYSFINSQVYPYSPYYRKLFDQHKIDPKKIRTVEDLKHIPLTSKKDFIVQDGRTEKYKEFILQPDKEKIFRDAPLKTKLDVVFSTLMHGKEYTQEKLAREYRPIFMTYTTGTTNSPVPFMYSDHDIENLRTSGARMLTLFNTLHSDRILNLFPFAPHLAFWQVFYGGMASYIFALSTGGGKVLGTEGNISAIIKSRPVMLLGVPSYIYHLLRLAQEKKADMSSVKKVVLGAARVTTAFKEKLAELLHSMGATNVQVMGTYGFTESRCAWAECPTEISVSAGYHLYPDKEIFEVVDPKTGEVKGDGEDGELVYTALDARASVVLRYRTGDFVKGGITWEPCPHCARTVPRISSDITRLSDIKDLNLSKVKGALINLDHFFSILNGIKQVDEWQIEIRKRNNDPFDVDELVIYLSVKAGVDQSALNDEIRKKVQLATEVNPNDIQYIPMTEMIKRLELETSNKDRRILDSRPKH